MAGSLCALLLSHQWPASPRRRPAVAGLGWCDGEVVVFARLPDAWIFSLADGPNQRMWELGDTFEMFFQAEGREDYAELHVTPQGHRLQLRIPSTSHFEEHREAGAFEEYLLPEPSFWSQVEIREGEWLVLARVPFELVGESARWRFSFCRYDYDDPGSEPVLSSSSDYRELDFHRVEDWGELEFAR